MSTAAAERSIGLLLAIAATAAILGTIGEIATSEQQAALAAHRAAPARLAAACTITPEPEPATRL